MAFSWFGQQFQKFLQEALGAEAIDAIYAANPALAGERADYVLHARSVVIEVKELEQSQHQPLARLLEDYCRELPQLKPGIVLSLDELIASHPRSKELEAQVERVVSRTLDRAIESANRQIRETRLTLGVPDALGLVVVLNSRNINLRQSLLVDTVSRAMTKLRMGAWRHESIEAVLTVSEPHCLAIGNSPGPIPINIIHHGRAGGREAAYVARNLLIQWAAFYAIPLSHMGRFEGTAVVRNMPVRTWVRPMVLDIRAGAAAD